MSEPWLDTLSEDWDPQPRSSSSLGVTGSTSSHATKSWIPCLSTAASPVDEGSSSQPLEKQKVLSERSGNQASKQPDSPLPTSSNKNSINLKTRAAETVKTIDSAGTVGSVVKRNSSQHGQGGDWSGQLETPGWKKLVLGNQKTPKSQVDLFTSQHLGLQNIFQKPTNENETHGSDKTDSPFRAMQLFQSTPPPWVLDEQSRRELTSIQEVSSDIEPSFGEDMNTAERFNVASNGAENKEKRKSPNSESQLMQLGAMGSSSTSGFSPVYISKHNTVDGRVDYAALDTSNPETLQMVKSRTSSNRQDFGHTTSELDSSLCLPSYAIEPYADESSQLAPISPYVTLQRGGNSDDEFFSRRPLSSVLPSSRGHSNVMPSDSISQRGMVDDFNSRQPSLMSSAAANMPSTAIDNRWSEKTEVASAPSNDTIVHCEDEQQNLNKANSKPHTGTKGAIHGVDDPQSDIIGKRPLSMEARASTPKRIRTLLHMSVSDHEHWDSKTSTIIGKRKDARYDGERQSCDPETLSRRSILRPRNISSQARDAFQELLDQSIGSDSDVTHDQHWGQDRATDVAHARSIATIAASIRAKELRSSGDAIRKPSVSTQDYVDEAMKIMEHLRSKRRLQEQTASQVVRKDMTPDRLAEITPQTFSRPPSRDGPASGWRPRLDTNLDEHVLDHLQKYQETRDEAFLVESVLQSMTIADEIEHGRPTATDPATSNHDHVSSHRSKASTGSSGQTIDTTLSHRSRTLPNISPDRVVHLLKGETIGMHFDKERQVWVKTRRILPAASIASGSDDPFQDIPDLKSDSDHSVPQPVEEHVETSRPHHLHDDLAILSSNENSESSSDFQLIPYGLRASHITMRHSNEEVAVPRKDPLGSNQEGNELRRKASVLLDDQSSLISVAGNRLPKEAYSGSYQVRGRQVSFKPVDQRLAALRRTELMPSSPPSMHEHREISLIQTRPGGRTMSLTLSMTTPIASRATVARVSDPMPVQPWPSMSPLSSFTLHQDDAAHIHARQMVSHSAKYNDFVVSEVTRELVERLTDAEPDELYWDAMRALNLTGTKAENLHMLDQFCPRIEELQLDQNDLRHLEGAPSSLRQLSVVENHLSGLMSWTHLSNLQYLDVSGNDLENLNALSELFHLRELKADNNKICGIGGAFDLDGLLLLSLRGNSIQLVDFEDANLTRLETLQLAGNPIQEVYGLEKLTALQVLELDRTDLKQIKICHDNLRELSLAENRLLDLDVSELPQLENLDVGNNHLTSIAGLQRLSKLKSLKMCSQRSAHGISMDILLLHAPDLVSLDVSGNVLLGTTAIQSSEYSCLSLKTLSMAMCGLDSLPTTFGYVMTNLRSLDLSHNAIKDIRPLAGMRCLISLDIRGNRISRLRRTVSVLSRIGRRLRSLDMRGNPLLLGFYAADTEVQNDDAQYVSKLDDDTRLRRLAYTLLMSVELPALENLDGRRASDQRSLTTKDADFCRLVDLGVVQQVTKNRIT